MATKYIICVCTFVHNSLAKLTILWSTSIVPVSLSFWIYSVLLVALLARPIKYWVIYLSEIPSISCSWSPTHLSNCDILMDSETYITMICPILLLCILPCNTYYNCCVLVWKGHSTLLPLCTFNSSNNSPIMKLYCIIFPIICCTISVLLLLNKLSFIHSHLEKPSINSF